MKWTYNLVRFSEGDATPVEWFVLPEFTPEPSITKAPPIKVESPGERGMEWANIQLKHWRKKYHLNWGKEKELKQMKEKKKKKSKKKKKLHYKWLNEIYIHTEQHPLSSKHLKYK